MKLNTELCRLDMIKYFLIMEKVKDPVRGKWRNLLTSYSPTDRNKITEVTHSLICIKAQNIWITYHVKAFWMCILFNLSYSFNYSFKLSFSILAGSQIQQYESPHKKGVRK